MASSRGNRCRLRTVVEVLVGLFAETLGQGLGLLGRSTGAPDVAAAESRARELLEGRAQLWPVRGHVFRGPGPEQLDHPLVRGSGAAPISLGLQVTPELLGGRELVELVDLAGPGLGCRLAFGF